MTLFDPSRLLESMAVACIGCDSCDNDIDIGDTLYVDNLAGNEESEAKVYCSWCVSQAWEGLI